MDAILWQPSQEHIEASNLYLFMQRIAKAHDITLSSYDDLYNWSIQNPGAFWEQVWLDTNIISHSPYQTPLRTDGNIQTAEWFPGSTLNFAENLLRRQDDAEAIVFRGERNERIVYTFRQLTDAVAKLALSLKEMGVTKGDRVAGLLPNIPETIIAMLATTSLGAVWSSCSPDFGLAGIKDRFGQVQPKVFISVDGYTFKGKAIPIIDTVEAIHSEISSIQKVIIFPFLDKDFKSKQTDTVNWSSIQSVCTPTLTFTPIAFSDPLYIMFSSGTTGKPKCIVHGAGGTLIQLIKELKYHTNLNENESLLYYTTCGWMMWNWMVTGLALGVRLVLYDGNPCYPDADSLLKIVDEEGVHVFGTSAKYISSVEKMGTHPNQLYSFSTLKAILSTGSPLSAENFDFVYHKIKSNVNLASICGGTDIISCFVLGNPMLPVYRGEIQCRGLGLAVSFYNDEGQAVFSEKGELVCEAPFPSMPLYFWNDSDGQKYHDAYFARFKNIWAHGDYGELTERNTVIIYGRADAVLNPGGVRIGTAEIYRQVEKLDVVLESLAIGQEWEDDTRIVLFVVLRESVQLSDELQQAIRKVIRENTTPRHVPAVIVQVPELPRTISGKIVELAVREIVHNRPVKNKDALANPAALDYFVNLPALQA